MREQDELPIDEVIIRYLVYIIVNVHSCIYENGRMGRHA